MKSFEQLGQAAYAAFCKKASTELAALKDREWTGAPPAWAELAPEAQACWVAVARHLVAEVAALH
jgi:hypothetical protein